MSVAAGLREPPPMLVARDDGGGGSGWTTLARVGDDIEAHLMSGRLAEAGVESRIEKDPTVPGAWLFGGSNPWAPVLVWVRRWQLDEARVVLAEIAWDAPPIAAEQRLHPSPKGRPVVWWLAAVGLGLLFTAMGLIETNRQLTRCNGSRCTIETGRP